MRIHAIQVGRLIGNRTTARGRGLSSILRRREDFEFPAYAYVIELSDGHIIIDTGLNRKDWSMPRIGRRIGAYPLPMREEDEIGPRMKAAGLRSDDVRTVVLTHLDADHAGGIGWFPDAEVCVHRPEYESTSSWLGRQRHQPQQWPETFDPVLYDLEPNPCGAFPVSKALDNRVDLRAVPLPGHSLGQVGFVLRMDGPTLLFSADHVLSQQWFLEDWKSDEDVPGLVNPVFWMPRYREAGVETSRRIRSFVDEEPTVLLPAHDSDAPRRLTEREPIRFNDWRS